MTVLVSDITLTILIFIHLFLENLTTLQGNPLILKNVFLWVTPSIIIYILLRKYIQNINIKVETKN